MKIYSKLKNWYDRLNYEDSDTSLDLDKFVREKYGAKGQGVSRLLCILPLIAVDYLTTKTPKDHYGVYTISAVLALVSPLTLDDISKVLERCETKFTEKLENTRLLKNLVKS